ncbi:MAG: polymerase sigma factor [Subtercola sp.]|nr:polymerase sigma factor [Subtercola sp.]
MSPPPTEAIDARFVQLYDDHYLDVLRFVTRRAHPLNVDDIVSETFIAAWIRRATVPEPALPWVYGVARNVMLTQVRGSSRRQALAVRVAGITPTHGADDVGDLERRLDVQAAFTSGQGFDWIGDDTRVTQMRGIVGAGVTAVTVHLAGGHDVQAAVQNGEWMAWWPENEPPALGGPTPTPTDGTLSAPAPAGPPPFSWTTSDGVMHDSTP